MLKPLSWWLQERFFQYGYRHRNRCAVVGFNLLFDIGRLAGSWTEGRKAYRGGFSLGIWGKPDRADRWHDARYHPRLLLRAIDPRRTLFSWGSLKEADSQDDPDPLARAQFVDLRTLTFALTDRSLTLEGACAAFGDHYEKQEVDYDTIDERLLDYAREDVEHTSLLYRNCLTELRQHQGVELAAARLYSPATVGAGYLEAMGLRRPLEKFTRLTCEELGWQSLGPHAGRRPNKRDALEPRLLGYSISSFYGGRAEARIVRTPVPVALVDFTSMYPSVNGLLGTWELLRADHLTVTDTTESAQSLLTDPDLLNRCLSKELWAQIGVTLVEVEPDGDVLPTRAQYEARTGNVTPDYGIGVNPLRYQGRLWYTLPDVIAATLLSPTVRDDPRIPTISRAVRLSGVGLQEGLKPVRLRGGREIDPTRHDPFIALIEGRQRVRADRTRPKEERERLDQFLKITANATAYGVLARYDRRDLAADTPLTVHGPDDTPTTAHTAHPEDPGPFCFPPVAASITAAARLMLALLERLVHDAGGSYAFCDTDSLAIVASRKRQPITCATADGKSTVTAMSWRQVKTILARFEPLNPYDPELVPSPWKVEATSLSRELWCYAISAKRYCLYRTDHGQPEIVAEVDGPDEHDDEDPGGGLEDWSEHGLGLYLDPSDPGPEGRSRRDSKGRRLWVREAWQWVLQDAVTDLRPPLPDWADRYALTRFTVTSPRLAQWFAGHDANRPPGDRIQPGSFGLIAHPEPGFASSSAQPAGPYETHPAKWPKLPWFDRQTGQPLRITTLQAADPEQRAHTLARGDIPISTIGSILRRYRLRPEHKSLAPDGQHGQEDTHGQLRRRSITSAPVLTTLIGKEGNKLLERATGQVVDRHDFETDYGLRNDRWGSLVLPVLKTIGAAHVIKETEIARTSVFALLAGQRRPRHEAAVTYEQVALAHATAELDRWGLPAPDDPRALLWIYLDRCRRSDNVRLCEWDGKPLPEGSRADRRYCSDACRRTASRKSD